MPQLILAEVDRARYDLPAEVPFEFGQHGMKAVDQLKRQTKADPETDGYWTLERIDAELTGRPVLQPDGTEIVERNDVATVAFAWVVLWDAGHRIPWTDFDLRGVPRYRSDGAGGEAEGKAPDPDTSSTATTSPDSPTGTTNSSSPTTFPDSPDTT